MPEPPPTAPPKDPDVLLLHSKTADGAGVRVLRERRGQIEVGEVRPLREGQPIVRGEIVSLKAREKTPWICDVESSVSVGEPASKETKELKETGRPAQVATDAYRSSWDRIFGSGVSSRELN